MGEKKTMKGGSNRPDVKGSQADYRDFKSKALALDPKKVVPMRADLQLVLYNVQVGVASVAEVEQEAKKLTNIKVPELIELPRLVLATIFADTQIDRSPPASEIRRLLARASELRALMLTAASSLVQAGLLPKGPVDAIKRGRGSPDLARDCVALAALFSKNGKELRGKHPVKAAEIEEAAELGTQLLKTMKSGRARPKPTETISSVDMRNRFWTLVVQRYDVLWRVGAFLFGPSDVEQKIPALQAKRGKRQKKVEPEKEPTE